MFCNECKVTLHYFNGRGRAEPMRLMMYFAKKEFKDNRMAKEDWPAFKSQTPLGQLPVLEFTDCDGKSTMLSQSHTQMRALGQLLGLDGKDAQTKIRADESYECIRELLDATSKALMEKDATRKEELKKAAETEVLPKMFTFLEKRAKENNGKTIAFGEDITYTDIALTAMIDYMYMKQNTENMEKMKCGFPTLFGIYKSVMETPSVKEYVDKRPKTDF